MLILLQGGSTEAAEKRAKHAGQHQVFCLSQCKEFLLKWKYLAVFITFIYSPFFPSSRKADFLVRSHSVIKSKRKHIRGTHLMDEDMVSYMCEVHSVQPHTQM